METKDTLRSKIRRLQNKVLMLQAQVIRLSGELVSAGRHQKNNTGLKGEKFLRDAFPGAIKSVVGSHDLDFRGKRLEVKTAQCLNVDRRREVVTRRWTWHRPLGSSNRNRYDYLVLLGAIDNRLRRHYKKPACNFVIFLVPRRTAVRYWGGTGRKIIQLTTDPQKQRTGCDQKLWKFEVSLEELGRRLRCRESNPR